MSLPMLPGPGEVHVRFARLDQRIPLADAERALSPIERKRSARLPEGPARRRFTAGRLFLRRVLAPYLGIEAQEVSLEEGEWGKPRIAGEREGSGVCFNLSHSADLAVTVVASGREVGIDLERIDDRLPYGEIARLFFSTNEQRELFSLPEGERLGAFYRCWTRKEAYLKGCGRGLSLPSDSFDVPLSPGSPPLLLEHRLAPADCGRWSLLDIPAPEGFAAALAFEGPPPAIRSFPME